MTIPETGPPRSRRPLVWAGLVGVILLGLPAVWLSGVTWHSIPAGDPVKDQAGLAAVRHRLSAAIGDLDRVADPVLSRATGGAHVTRCSVDDGEVFEPELSRVWRLRGAARGSDSIHITEPGRAVARELATALVARGWTGSTALDEDAATFLSKTWDHVTIRLTVQAFGTTVLVDGSVRHHRVCQRQV